MFSAWQFSLWFLTPLAGVLTLLASGHALLHKRDPRAALLWILICVLLPFLGPLLYVMFGVNRAWRRIRRMGQANQSSLVTPPEPVPLAAREALLEPAQIRLGAAVTGLPLLDGNQVTPLVNGDRAYPVMVDAVRQAREWIYLVVYIFEHRGPGEAFIEALIEAAGRGVEVYVLLDGVGAWYSFDRTRRRLRKGGVHVVSFLPPRLFPPQLQINLRNHRKLLLVDGERGFTGGMNIRACHLIGDQALDRHATRDVMFEVSGPVLAHLEEVFAEDWLFMTGEKLPARLFPQIETGSMKCRPVVDGPGVHIYTLVNLLVGAFSMASQRILIVTPYFLPPPELSAALQAAALRGVEVTLLLPEKSNLRYVDWATRKILPGLLDCGVRVFWQAPPFDHSKLLVIDGYYCIVGSANMDIRSLRLNFELVLEVYSRSLGRQLEQHIEQLQRDGHEVRADALRNEPLAMRLWYAIWWLFTPYL